MKIVLTKSGNDINAPMDGRFGRAPKFLLYNLHDGTFEVIDNLQNLNAPQGAGIQPAESVARLGSKILITGHCGPKAFRVLNAAGIRILGSHALTVAAAIAQYRSGELTEAKTADV